MIRLQIILLAASFLFPGAERKKMVLQINFLNPFDTLKYDKAIAYDYDGETYRSIVEDGQLVKFDGFHGEIFAQKELIKGQVATLHKIIGDTSTYGGTPASCFDPHLGIVYYRKNIIVGHISICLGCNYLEASMKIPARGYKKYYLLGDSTQEKLTAHGFTRRGSKRLSDICKELNFSHCDFNPESPFFNLKLITDK